MPNPDPVQLVNFKGLNYDRPKSLIEDNEFQDLVNMVNYKGVLEKRPGVRRVKHLNNHYRINLGTGHFDFFPSISNPIEMLQMITVNSHYNVKEIHTTFLMFMDSVSNRLFYLPTPDSAITPEPSPDGNIWNTAIRVGVSPDTFIPLSNVLVTGILSTGVFTGGKILIAGRYNGVDGIYEIVDVTTGAGRTYKTYAAISTSVDPLTRNSQIIMHAGRVFIKREVTLRFSNPGEFTINFTGSAVNLIEINPTNIISIHSINDSTLLLVCDDGLRVLRTIGPPQNWSLTKLHSIMRPYKDEPKKFTSSIKLSDGFVYILTTSGLFRTNGEQVEKINTPIDKLFRDISSKFLHDWSGSDPNIQIVGNLGQRVEISIFNPFRNELLLRVPNQMYVDTLSDPQQLNVPDLFNYFVYNIDNDSWSKFEFNLSYPAIDPFSTDPNPVLFFENFPFYLGGFNVLATRGVGNDYSSQYIKALNVSSPPVDLEAVSSETLYCMGYSIHNGNILYAIDYNNILGIFTDDSSHLNDGNTYISKAITKNYDFGYRGINKKISKEFMSVATESIEGVDLQVNHIVNDSVEVPFLAVVDKNSRNIKMPGPGYFIEYALEISDIDCKEKWSLEAISFDVFNKSEALTKSGTA